MENLKLIGKGKFTKAFLNTTTNKVILKTTCQAKECAALGWLPNSRLFPELTFIENGLYEMDYLGKTDKGIKSKLRPRQLRFYKELEKIYCRGYSSIGKRNQDLFFHWHKQFDLLPSEFKKEKEILKEALDSLGNFGTNVCFEISPRNVREKNGFLILLDCFYFTDK